MKRFFILLLAMSVSILLQAQEHITFKNIPIDGTASQFVSKLKSDGFVQIGSDNDGIWMKGKFTGRDCRVLVQSTSVTHTVYAVYALFDNRSEWSMAKADYNALKAALTKKYGEPDSVEQFEKYYKEDGYEFMHMKDGHVVWQSDYETSNGWIYLYIKDQSVSSGCAIVQYRDKLNAEKATDELTSDL